MMGRLNHDQGELFYSFCLEKVVPDDHLVRKTLRFSTWRGFGLSSPPIIPALVGHRIDPELMIRMLIIGYVFAIRSERLLCRELQVNLAYRWFCRLSIEDKINICPADNVLATTGNLVNDGETLLWWRRVRRECLCEPERPRRQRHRRAA
jgi:Transposase domain (DUF772)